MSERTLPFDSALIASIRERFPTPFYIYDEAAIRKFARELLATFSWSPDFKEYFAVKATPTPAIMKILAEEGFGADCSSWQN